MEYRRPRRLERARRRQALLVSCALAFTGASGGIAAAQQATERPLPPTPPRPSGAVNETVTEQATEDGAYTVESLVVTALRPEQGIEDAPISVTTFSAEERNLLSANTVAQLIDLTPGVYLSNFGINIRGLGRGQPTTTLGSENPVALYVNGFYNFEPGTIGESTLFGGNVQFLRGPQGTRYGRDAIGGAANLIARRPTEDFKGEAVIGYGRREFSNLGVTFSGPINEDYGFRFSAQSFNQGEPTQKNIAPFPAGFDSDNLYVELQLEGDVTDRLHFLLRSSHFEYMNSPGASTENVVYFTQGASMGALVPSPTYRYEIAGVPEARTINSDYRGWDRLTGNQVYILNADYDFGGATLYYVGGYANFKAKGSSDNDGTSRAGYTVSPERPFPGLANGTFVDTFQTANYLNRNEYFSHELRLENDDAERFEWVAGLYFLKTNYNERFFQSQPRVAALATPISSFTPVNGVLPLARPNPERNFYQQQNIQRQQSAAVFGHVDYDLTEHLTLGAGLRYTVDAKRATTDFRYIFYNPAFGSALDSTPPAALGGRTFKIADDGVTARLEAEYRPDDDTLLYASYARGYKAGSLTLGDQPPVTAPGTNSTRPESLNAYELGVKKDSPTAGLRVEATGFFYDYSNYQQPFTVANPFTGGTLAQYVNVPESTLYGLELQTDWNPIDALTVSANYSYLHSEISGRFLAQDISAPALGLQNLEGRQLPRSPAHKASLAGTYTLGFDPGDLILGATVAHTGEQFTTAFENSLFRLDAYTVTNLTATFRTANNQFDIVGALTNAFDVDYETAVGVGGANTNFARTLFLAPDRFYSLTLRYRF